jgi:shikimate 5-dehydrogenase/shikimate kinase
MAGVKRSLGTMLGHDHNDPHATLRRSRASFPAEWPDPTTTATPPPASPPLICEIPDFRVDASIVLVGIRGAGKSTLAIMASSAMNRKVIDLETAFQRACGTSSASYKRLNGTPQCHEQQAKILQSILERNRTDCIIVCSWIDSRVQALLREFAATNPVIHVVRDVDAIQEHLKISDSEKMRTMLSVSRALFRTCTNLEFFNVSEKVSGGLDSPSSDPVLDRLAAPYLSLKQAERHLLKFLSLIFPPGAIPFIESAFPLALVPTEERQFTYAVSLPLSDLLQPDFEIEDHLEGADVVQIVVRDLDRDVDGPRRDNTDDLAGQITRAVGHARRGTVLPLAIHIVLPETPGEDIVRSYLELVSHAFRLAPEMATVDLRLDDTKVNQLVATKGRSKVIGDRSISVDPPPWDSPTWPALYQKASQLGCDLVRLVRPASSIDDNLTISHFRTIVKTMDCRPMPLISYNTGKLGRTSACFNPILTTVAPESASVADSNLQAESYLTIRAATKALFSSFVYDEMKLYVFGAKVGYSMSPAMHNSALAACGLPHRYRPYSTRSLSSIKHLIEDPFFGGASIGLPFKVEVITLIHSLSRHARAIGAVNTLIPVRQLNPDGSLPQGAEFFKGMGRAGPVKALYGENTDWIGIRACIRRGLSPANAVRPGTSGMIVGAGGMARAALYAMLQVGIQNVAIYNRTTSNAETLATHFAQLLGREDFQLLGAGKDTRFHVIGHLGEPWPSQFNLPTIIISCIPTHSIGDVPAPDFTVPDEWLGSRTGGVIIELGYKTLDTPLLAQARREAARGWVAMTGLDLLPEQGFAQFELFTGKRAPRKIMRRDLLRAYSAESRRSRELQSRQASDAEDDG